MKQNIFANRAGQKICKTADGQITITMWSRRLPDGELILLGVPEETASPQLAHVNIDIEIDRADAGLLRAVGAAFMPAAFARPGLFDIGQPLASPLRKRA